MPQLRIGFLAHDWERVEPWVHRLVSQVQASDNLTVSALIGFNDKAEKLKGNWLHTLSYPLERRLFAPSVAADLTAVESLRANQRVIPSSDADGISDLELDVIICVESGAAAQKISKLTRHGIWFLDIFDQAEGLGALQAVVGRDPVARIGLVRHLEGKKNIETIAVATINPKFLLSRNALFMKEKSVVLILRELQRLAKNGFVILANDITSVTHTTPGTAALMRYFGSVAKQLANKGVATIKRRTGLRPDKFILLTGQGDALSFDPKMSTEIAPEGNNFWADPFLWEKDGKTYCFYEHYSRASKVGHIQVGEFDGNQMNVIGDALKTEIHLSFPYLFEHKDQLFMMPETCAAKRIEIWRCTEFPLKWELHSTALEGQSVADSMILRRDGKWWLFTNIANDIYSDNCSELHIFQIDGPDLKNVKPHAANPVVMDSRTARNAGRFHEIDGHLYRPSQDNAYGQYGYGLNIMKVEELSLETYRETLVRRIDPKFDRSMRGCHHFDAVGDRFIMDALKAS